MNTAPSINTEQDFELYLRASFRRGQQYRRENRERGHVPVAEGRDHVEAMKAGWDSEDASIKGN